MQDVEILLLRSFGLSSLGLSTYMYLCATRSQLIKKHKLLRRLQDLFFFNYTLLVEFDSTVFPSQVLLQVLIAKHYAT